MQVVPAALDVEASSLASAGSSDVVAGEPLTFVLTPRDSLGNTWNAGPLDVQAYAVLYPAEPSTANQRLVLPVSVSGEGSGSLQLSVVSEKVLHVPHLTGCPILSYSP